MAKIVFNGIAPDLFLDAYKFGSEHQSIHIYAAPEIANDGPIHVLVSYQTFAALQKSIEDKLIMETKNE